MRMTHIELDSVKHIQLICIHSSMLLTLHQTKCNHMSKSVNKKVKNANGLNDRQTLFVEEYIKDFNGSRAAIAAGYSKAGAGVAASRMLKKDNIKKAVDEAKAARIERVQSESDWLLKTLLEQGNADQIDIVDKNGNLKNINDWPEHWRKGLVSSFTTRVDKDGEISTDIRFNDRTKILKMIGDHVNVRAFIRQNDVNVNVFQGKSKAEIVEGIFEMIDAPR